MIKKIFLFVLPAILLLLVLVYYSSIDKTMQQNNTEHSKTEAKLKEAEVKYDKSAADFNTSNPLINSVTTKWEGDLDAMLKRRIIRVLVTPTNILYHIDKGKNKGMVYDVMMEFDKKINKRFPHDKKHLDLDIVFVPVSREKLIPWLLEGRGDIVFADMAVTRKRSTLVEYTDALVDNVNTIVITGSSSYKVESLDDLAGSEIPVRRSSSQYEYLEALNEKFTEQGKHPIKLLPIPDQLEDEDLLKLLNAGLIDIVIMDDYKAAIWSRLYKNIRLHREFPIRSGVRIAWMLRKNSPKLLNISNEFIKTHKLGTPYGNNLIMKYIINHKPVDINKTKEKMAEFEKMKDKFIKYSKKYDLDYHMMMAQAWQESRFRQHAKSRVGATGVMQLMPKTGKSLKVGNIKKLDANIHAGVKYHRLLIDRHLNKYDMDELNKTLFAFAAYNAGPGRVRGLRKLAKKQGYDPNVWFDNVEVVAAEKIGSETVTYVSNIYKYYIASALYEEEKKMREKAKLGLIRPRDSNTSNAEFISSFVL